MGGEEMLPHIYVGELNSSAPLGSHTPFPTTDNVDEETSTEIPNTQVPNRKLGTRAASTLVDSGCQCSSLTFMDQYQNRYENCKR